MGGAKEKYLLKLAKHEEMMSDDKKQPCHSVATLCLWLQVRKRKADRKIPTKKAEMMKLKDLWAARPILLLREYLEDLGKDKKDIEDVLEESANETREETQNEQEFLPIETTTNEKSDDPGTKMRGEFI